MFKVSSFFVENNLINDLKRYKSKLAYSFMIGLIIGSLPFIYKVTENFRVQKLIQEQKPEKMVRCKTKKRLFKQQTNHTNTQRSSQEKRPAIDNVFRLFPYF